MFIGILGNHTPISDYIVSRNEQLEHVSHLLYGRLSEAVCNQYGILRIRGSEYAVNVSLKISSLLTVLVDHVMRHNRYIGFVGIEITFYNQVILIMFKCP